MEDELFELDDLFSPGAQEEERDPDAERWDILMDQIVKGNVVPIIGPDILQAASGGESDYADVNQTLIGGVARLCGIKTPPKTFSQLVYDDDFVEIRKVFKNTKERDVTKIKDAIYNVLGKMKYDKLQPSELVMRLLRTRQFPFVITTSFTPLVEKALSQVWPDAEVKTYVFDNYAKSASATTDAPMDIQEEQDLSVPSVYYMFGRAQSMTPRSFVVTDGDMLAFCKSWLSDNRRPKLLSGVLKNKYLLVLGCSYSDWLFRFIWYSLKTSDNHNAETGNPGLVALTADDGDDDAAGHAGRLRSDASLIEFLNRTDAFTQTDPKVVVDEIERRLKGMQDRLQATQHEDESDVFISYSRSDSEVAARLNDALTAKGIKTWFDRGSLEFGDDFMAQIERGISKTRYFLPVLSRNILKEVNDKRVYRAEWIKATQQAAQYSESRGFIIPVSEQGFDFYGSDLPSGITSRNAFFFDYDQPHFEQLADSILEKLKQLHNA